MTIAPLLLCYDGSPDAKLAIARAAATFEPRPAIVVSVWQVPPRPMRPSSSPSPGNARPRPSRPKGSNSPKRAGSHRCELLPSARPAASGRPFSMCRRSSAPPSPSWAHAGGAASGPRFSAASRTTSSITRRPPTFVVQHYATESAAKAALIAYDGSDDAQAGHRMGGAGPGAPAGHGARRLAGPARGPDPFLGGDGLRHRSQ